MEGLVLDECLKHVKGSRRLDVGSWCVGGG